MYIFSEYRRLLAELLVDWQLDGNVSVEKPKDKKFGDLTTNIAMLIAKSKHENPMTVAKEVINVLSTDFRFENVSVAAPGFINWRVPRHMIFQQLKFMLTTDYGRSSIGLGQKINIEYVSANPTGPLHAGHARSAVVGDALANLLSYVGYNVTKEYYINDAGKQIDNLAKSLRFRYMQIVDPDNTPREPTDDMYPGEYLVDLARKLVSEYGDAFKYKSDWLELFKSFAVSNMMDMIKSDLKALGIQHDVFSSEKSIVELGKVDECIKYLGELGLTYHGVLPKPKGKLLDDWEEREQLLFKSTEFGDSVDRPLVKSDGTWTYFATDIAYHFDKFNRGFTDMIDFWGADHGGYIVRMTAATRAVTQEKAKLSVKICQLVKFSENGQDVKMSKRAGTFITVKDIIDKVGKDIIRFIMLTRRDDATLEFDFAKVVEQSKDNPVFYVQYALARTYSVFNNFSNIFGKPDFNDIDFEQISSKEELELLLLLADWPRQVELAALHREPHRIAFFLTSIASEFHALWNAGKSDSSLRFIDAQNKAVSLSKLALVVATQKVLECGLRIIGVTAVKELR